MIESDEPGKVASPQLANQVVRFSTRIFDIETIKKAAYRMSGYCAFDFAAVGDDVVCTLRPHTGRGQPLVTDLADTFRTEVLDQDLRRIIGAESAPIRNAVLAYAFSRTGLQELE